MCSFEDKNYIIAGGRSGWKQKHIEAEQHVKTLEELNKKLSAIVWNFKEYGDDALYKEALEAIKALNFAIDFIKWGMK